MGRKWVEFQSISKSMIMVVGDYINIRCYFTAVATYRLTWIYARNPLQIDHHKSDTSETCRVADK